MKNKIKKLGLGVMAALLLCFSVITPVMATDPYEGGFDQERYIEAGEGGGMTTATITQIVEKVIQWMLYMLGFLAIIVFIVAGIMYLTSGGDETKTEKAKKWIVYAIVGIVIALGGLIIMNLIVNFLGIE